MGPVSAGAPTRRSGASPPPCAMAAGDVDLAAAGVEADTDDDYEMWEDAHGEGMAVASGGEEIDAIFAPLLEPHAGMEDDPDSHQDWAAGADAESTAQVGDVQFEGLESDAAEATVDPDEASREVVLIDDGEEPPKPLPPQGLQPAAGGQTRRPGQPTLLSGQKRSISSVGARVDAAPTVLRKASMEVAAKKPAAKWLVRNPLEKFRKYSSIADLSLANSRLDSPSVWEAATCRIGEWVQLDLGVEEVVAGVLAQGRRDSDRSVTQYAVQYSSDGKMWRQVKTRSETRFRGICKGGNAKSESLFDAPIRARHWKLVVEAWRERIALRMALILSRPGSGDAPDVGARREAASGQNVTRQRRAIAKPPPKPLPKQQPLPPPPKPPEQQLEEWQRAQRQNPFLVLPPHLQQFVRQQQQEQQHPKESSASGRLPQQQNGQGGRQIPQPPKAAAQYPRLMRAAQQQAQHPQQHDIAPPQLQRTTKEAASKPSPASAGRSAAEKLGAYRARALAQQEAPSRREAGADADAAPAQPRAPARRPQSPGKPVEVVSVPAPDIRHAEFAARRAALKEKAQVYRAPATQTERMERPATREELAADWRKYAARRRQLAPHCMAPPPPPSGGGSSSSASTGSAGHRGEGSVDASSNAATTAPVDAEGRQFDLHHVVVNFANVGATYGEKVLRRTTRLFDYEGVRRCVRHLVGKGFQVVGVIYENFRACDDQGREVCSVPDDIKQMCESIELTPRITGVHQRSADDEMTIKCAYRRNCRFLDNDNYSDWRRAMQDTRVRSWLEQCQGFLQMRYFFDTGLGTFDTLDGNSGPPGQQLRSPSSSGRPSAPGGAPPPQPMPPPQLPSPPAFDAARSSDGEAGPSKRPRFTGAVTRRAA